MTTRLDLGTNPKPEMLRCPRSSTNVYSTLVLALRDFRHANGREGETGAGDGNESWVALSIGMIVLDTLSGTPGEPVRKRWKRLLTTHGLTEPDASLIYELRCSLLHGYGVPKPARIEGRRLLLDDNPNGYAVDTEQTGRATVSVPVFCTYLVERIANQAKLSWDLSLINTDLHA